MKSDLKRNAPKYQQVADEIMRQVAAHGAEPGGYLPTEMVWAKKFKVNRLTVRRALSCLEREKLISPVIAKRRRFIGAPKMPATLIGCLGYGAAADESFNNLVHTRMFEQMVPVFQAENMYLLKFVMPPGAVQMPDPIRTSMIRGLLAFRPLPDDWTRDLRVPILTIGDSYKQPLDGPVLAFDGIGVAMDAVHYLAARGHRHVALALSSRAHCFPHYDDIISGYLRGLHQCGLGAPAYLELSAAAEANADQGAVLARRLFEVAPDTDALVLSTSDLAPGVLAALRAIGKRVPEQLSVVTTGGVDPEVPEMALTRFANDYPALARCACEYILELLSGRIRHIKKVVARHYRLQEGLSVAAR